MPDIDKLEITIDHDALREATAALEALGVAASKADAALARIGWRLTGSIEPLPGEIALYPISSRQPVRLKGRPA